MKSLLYCFKSILCVILPLLGYASNKYNDRGPTIDLH